MTSVEGPTAWFYITKAYQLTNPVGEMGVWLEVGISEFHSSSWSRWIKTTKSVCSTGFKCQPEHDREEDNYLAPQRVERKAFRKGSAAHWRHLAVKVKNCSEKETNDLLDPLGAERLIHIFFSPTKPAKRCHY